MDATFAHAISQISELPHDTQRVIGEALLSGAGQPNLPVIEFTAEEHALLDEAEVDIAHGAVIEQDEMKQRFEALRAASYAAL